MSQENHLKQWSIMVAWENLNQVHFSANTPLHVIWAVLRYKPEHGTSRVPLDSNESKESAVSSNSGLRRQA